VSMPTGDGARDAALRALLQIERGAAAGSALDRALREVPDVRDRALTTELAYGVTRMVGALDAELAPLCTRPLQALEPGVRGALRLGLYQLRYMDRIPAYAAVAGSVDLARRHARPAAAGLVNAILRKAAATGPPTPLRAAPGEAPGAAALAQAHSHPEWLVRRWLARLGPTETIRLLRANNRAPAVTLRANPLRCDGAALAAELATGGITCRPGRWLPEAVVVSRGMAPGRLAAFAAGRCTVQGEASMLVGHLADPAPGALCLDVAAAPGGKATHLAERMGNQGTVIANDSAAGRVALCRSAAARLGLDCIRTQVADGRALPLAFADRCDVVVADLPCSGLGALAGRPDLRWRKREADIAALALLQAELVAAAGRCVKPGGRLVYSTCTTEPEENEAIVAGFLAAHPDYEPEDARPRLPDELAAQPGAAAGLVRLWPHLHETEGFFIAVLRRQGRGTRPLLQRR